ncbi:energy-coupling factor transporter transmembrane component T [Solibacillus sp. FSL W8-0474]|uniref:energy-coupling factor transporter transmembrane component T n=1 Tax=Solibacillus sp. FSL W8-0474 TaxID=2975336 RepID=UPI0030F7F6DC
MTAFETYHPIVLFAFFLSVIGIGMFIMHPVFLVITICAAMSVNFAFRRGRFLRDWKLYVPLFIIMAIINPLISHDGKMVLFYLNGNAVTVEAICYGVAMATMLTAVMLWFSSYNEVMTSDKFLYLFGKLSPVLALTLSITIRLVPRFQHQLMRIARAQKTMGMDYTTGSLVNRAKCTMRIISILITWALENAIETADSMKARGYGIGKRSSFSLFLFEKRDGIMLGMISFLVALLLTASALGYATFYYYPTFTAIDWSWNSITVYAIYTALLMIPLVIEVRETRKWKYLKSKM